MYVLQNLKPLPLYEPLRVSGDISKAKTVLGYNPVTSIDEGGFQLRVFCKYSLHYLF